MQFDVNSMASNCIVCWAMSVVIWIICYVDCILMNVSAFEQTDPEIAVFIMCERIQSMHQ